MAIKYYNPWSVGLLIGQLFVVTACGGGNDTKLQPDTTAPVITLLGDSNVTIIKNTVYNDSGATAADNIDGIVNVTTSGTVDIQTLGEYTITYSATDSAGNTTTIERMIMVVIDPSRQPVANIDFPDASLKLCVEDNDNNYFYADEFLTLNCSYYGIDNLKGLSYFTNLTHLNIFGNLQSDLTLVSNLTQLTFLNAGYNQLRDISFLSGLINLQTLYLSNNSITNIAALNDLTQLVDLDLNENNGIEDILGITNMTKLEQLQLNRNRIRDITPLAELKQLKHLTLYTNNIIDISGLAGLTNLIVLNLASNNITDVSPLAGLTEIVELKLLNNDVDTGVDSLNAFDNLEAMYLNGNDNIPCPHLDILHEAYGDEVVSMPEKCAAVKED